MVVITDLTKHDFESILLDYDIGTYKSHKHILWALQNTVYVVNTTQGKFILKIFEDTEVEFIKYQIDVIEYLSQNKILVAPICKTNNKQLLNYKHKNIAIQQYIEGGKPVNISRTLCRDIAKSMASMNILLSKLKNRNMWEWQNDHQFKPDERRVKYLNFMKEEDNLLDEMKTLDKSKLRKQMIHSDLHGINLLVKNNKLVGILDWDDSHYDYLAYEVSVFIMGDLILKTGIKTDLIKVFMQEYQKTIKFNKTEMKAVYYFIKKRLITVIYWHIMQMQNHPDRKSHLKRTLNELIDCYEHYSKFSAEQFITLTESH